VLDGVTAQYVDVRLERKEEVLFVYHKALLPEALNLNKDQRSSDWERERGEREER
jgi:hypothetical protein